MGVHPWTGYMIDVVALQQTLKEACHNMQVAREFTHERTKQQIAHLNTLAVVPAMKGQPAMTQRSPRGWGMTRWADQFFVQQQLKEMNLDEPAFAQRPALLGTHLETPEYEQFDSTQEDAEEDEGDVMSALDAELDVSMGEETDVSGHPHHMPSPDQHHQRNHALQRERNRVCWEFWRPKNGRLSFPLFRETTKEDAISYRDWRSEIEDALEQGHSAAKVKEAMFASLEGMTRDNAKMINNKEAIWLYAELFLGHHDGSCHGLWWFVVIHVMLCAGFCHGLWWFMSWFVVICSDLWFVMIHVIICSGPCHGL